MSKMMFLIVILVIGAGFALSFASLKVNHVSQIDDFLPKTWRSNTCLLYGNEPKVTANHRGFPVAFYIDDPKVVDVCNTSIEPDYVNKEKFVVNSIFWSSIVGIPVAGFVFLKKERL